MLENNLRLPLAGPLGIALTPMPGAGVAGTGGDLLAFPRPTCEFFLPLIECFEEILVHGRQRASLGRRAQAAG